MEMVSPLLIFTGCNNEDRPIGSELWYYLVRWGRPNFETFYDTLIEIQPEWRGVEGVAGNITAATVAEDHSHRTRPCEGLATEANLDAANRSPG